MKLNSYLQQWIALYTDTVPLSSQKSVSESLPFGKAVMAISRWQLSPNPMQVFSQSG